MKIDGSAGSSAARLTGSTSGVGFGQSQSQSQSSSRLSRLWDRVAYEIRRPSLLSTSSDSEDTYDFDQLDASPATRDATKIFWKGFNGNGSGNRKGSGSGPLRQGDRRQKKGNNDSSSGGITFREEIFNEKEEAVPVSVVVINDEILIPEDNDLLATISINDDITKTSLSNVISQHTPKTGKTGMSEAKHVGGKMFSKMKSWGSLIWFFFDMRFAEKSKEKSYLREVSPHGSF